MHAAAKVMFALGGVICLIGIVMWVGGAEAAEIDIEEEADWSGTSGDWYHDFFGTRIGIVNAHGSKILATVTGAS